MMKMKIYLPYHPVSLHPESQEKDPKHHLLLLPPLLIMSRHLLAPAHQNVPRNHNQAKNPTQILNAIIDAKPLSDNDDNEDFGEDSFIEPS